MPSLREHATLFCLRKIIIFSVSKMFFLVFDKKKGSHLKFRFKQENKQKEAFKASK